MKTPFLRRLAFACLVATGLGAAGGAAADETPILGLPIDCEIGETCWIVQYPDADPGPGRLDYRCGWLSYDGAKGTDFGIRDRRAMRQGVRVIAAADGIVGGVRDGMPDVSVDTIGAEAVKGRECGNGVRIEHGGGWFSLYCHLRNGSIAVSEGDRVSAGDFLGYVGLSGSTEFPHVDLSVFKDGQPVDPFIGEQRDSRCGWGPTPLWRPEVRESLTYQSAIVHNAGFAAGVPGTREIREGVLDGDALPADAPALVFWIDTYWPRPGDSIAFRITGPDGAVIFEERTTVDKRISRNVFYAGLKRRGGPWPAGTYLGEARLERAAGPIGAETHVIRRQVTVGTPG